MEWLAKIAARKLGVGQGSDQTRGAENAPSTEVVGTESAPEAESTR
jgi:hypothetical protein